jgi:hypothetical protein
MGKLGLEKPFNHMFGISNLKMIRSYSFLFQRTLRGCYYTTHVTKLWLWMSSTLEQYFLDPSQWQSAASRWLRLSHVNDRSDVWAEVRLVEVARNMNHGAFVKDISQNGKKNIEKQCFWAISATVWVPQQVPQFFSGLRKVAKIIFLGEALVS